MRTRTFHRTGTVEAPVEVVFEAALSLPLPQLYSRRYGPMPPIVAVHDQQGEWATPGQTRVLVTADDGAMHEEMLAIERPHGFTNRLTVLRGPFRPLVATVTESWSFRPRGPGGDGSTAATWEWHLEPRSRLGAVLAVVIGRLWYGYAGRVLQQLAVEVARSGPA